MKTVSEILEESQLVYNAKEGDYGRSWQKSGEILHHIADGEPVVLESPEDWIAVGLFTRRMDKITRSFNSEMLGEEMNFEAGVDSDKDSIPYAGMQAKNKYNRKARDGDEQ